VNKIPELFLKISDLCDHDTSTLRTDRRTTCRSSTALCVASCGKNCYGRPAWWAVGFSGNPLACLLLCSHFYVFLFNARRHINMIMMMIIISSSKMDPFTSN